MDIYAELKPLVTKIKNRVEIVEEALYLAPAGRLTQEHRNGKDVLMVETYDDGRRRRHCLTGEPEYAAALIRRDLLKAELDALLVNCKLLTQAAEKASHFSIDVSIHALKQRMSAVTDELLHLALSDSAAEGWAAAPYEQLQYRTEEKRHMTSRGLRVRSKSELLIAEKLYEYGLPFRYEEVMHFQNVDIAPDFTIRRADGKLFYWEHEGLTNSERYVNWQQRKAQLYAGAGIVPWDNFIVTYDSDDGTVDIRVIDSEIRNRLLV